MGGGCSGLTYQMEFTDETPGPSSRVFEHGDTKLITDLKSCLFLDGITIDYSGGLNGTGFNYINPKAKRICGCGSSFST